VDRRPEDMRRRPVIAGALSALTAGCTDRLHDVAASTPGDVGVTTRSIDGDPLVDERSVEAATLDVAVSSFRSGDAAAAAVDPAYPDARGFVEATPFVDDGGDAVLITAGHRVPKAVDARLGSVSRIGDHGLRIAVDEVGHPPPNAETAPQTLLVRIADERGPPERVTVEFDGDYASVTI